MKIASLRVPREHPRVVSTPAPTSMAPFFLSSSSRMSAVFAARFLFSAVFESRSDLTDDSFG